MKYVRRFAEWMLSRVCLHCSCPRPRVQRVDRVLRRMLLFESRFVESWLRILKKLDLFGHENSTRRCQGSGDSRFKMGQI